MMSYFASGNYNYDNKYYLSASFRRDGSSRLSEDNRWASFWSVSGAWRMSKEGLCKICRIYRLQDQSILWYKR